MKKLFLLYFLSFNLRAAYFDRVTIKADTPANQVNALKIDGSATTQPVSGAVTANLGTIADVATETSLNTLLKPASTLAAVTSLGSIVGALPAGTNSIGTVQQATLTKGNQSATGVSVQALKDSGRVSKFYSATFSGTVAEAMITLTPITNSVAGVASTSFAVTAGKILRIMQICVSTRNAGAAGQGIVVQLRTNAAAATVLASPLVGTVATGSNLAVANSSNSDCMIFADGFEISGTQQFGLSQVGTATANNSVVVSAFEY